MTAAAPADRAPDRGQDTPPDFTCEDGPDRNVKGTVVRGDSADQCGYLGRNHSGEIHAAILQTNSASGA